MDRVGTRGGPDRATRPHGVLLATGLAWAAYFAWIWPRMFFERGDGLVAGWRTLWADWAAHLAYAEVFAQRSPADWLARHPLQATAPFDYPFLADALSGGLMRAGLDRVDAFVWPSLLASWLLVVALLAFYARVLKTPGRAALATTLFFTNGGLGFVFDLRDLWSGGATLAARESTWRPELHIEWINVVSSELLPQRGLLLGLGLGLLVLGVLLRWRARGFAGVGPGRLAGLGAAASVLLVTHAHSFLALGWVCAWLLLFDRRHWRPWLGFALATAIPGAALGWLCYGGIASRSFVAWFPGWLANPEGPHPMSFWRFLALNWGAFLPLAGAAVLRSPWRRDPLVWAGGTLFVACMLLRFQPHAWDNTKLLTWAHLLLCAPVADGLAGLSAWRRPAGRALAAGLAAVTMASGALDLWRIADPTRRPIRMWTTEELALADAFRAIAPPDAVVLTSDHHHHFVPSLAGRAVLLGYRGWLASYGVDTDALARDVARMLSTGDPALLARYGVDFAVIGPTEREHFGARDAAFERWPLVLEGADHRIYDLRSR